jgi:hypothetical protein
MTIDLASARADRRSARAGRDATLPPTMAASTQDYEIRFQSLFREGRALAFPCDHHGQIDWDNLPARARDNYLFARAMVGREFATPAVQPCTRQTH